MWVRLRNVQWAVLSTTLGATRELPRPFHQKNYTAMWWGLHKWQKKSFERIGGFGFITVAVAWESFNFSLYSYGSTGLPPTIELARTSSISSKAIGHVVHERALWSCCPSITAAATEEEWLFLLLSMNRMSHKGKWEKGDICFHCSFDLVMLGDVGWCFSYLPAWIMILFDIWDLLENEILASNSNALWLALATALDQLWSYPRNINFELIDCWSDPQNHRQSASQWYCQHRPRPRNLSIGVLVNHHSIGVTNNNN